MKRNTSTIAVTAIALTVLAWGCGDAKQENAPPATDRPAASSEASEAAKGARLGVEKADEHFAIALTAEPAEPTVGKAKFIAKVLHHGEPTKDATVKVSLSMPSMNMGGPEITLKHTADGVYQGEADLSMGGDWQAKVSVEQEGHTGEAIYDFVVMQ